MHRRSAGEVLGEAEGHRPHHVADGAGVVVARDADHDLRRPELAHALGDARLERDAHAPTRGSGSPRRTASTAALQPAGPGAGARSLPQTRAASAGSIVPEGPGITIGRSTASSIGRSFAASPRRDERAVDAARPRGDEGAERVGPCRRGRSGGGAARRGSPAGPGRGRPRRAASRGPRPARRRPRRGTARRARGTSRARRRRGGRPVSATTSSTDSDANGRTATPASRATAGSAARSARRVGPRTRRQPPFTNRQGGAGAGASGKDAKTAPPFSTTTAAAPSAGASACISARVFALTSTSGTPAARSASSAGRAGE